MTEDQTAVALSRLTLGEYETLTLAALDDEAGGAPITGPLRDRCEELGLVFQSTGRLKTWALRMLEV